MRCGELLREIEPARGAKQNMRWKLADAYLQHFDADDIARLRDFARVLDVSIGHRGDVHQPVLVDPHINKGAKRGHVRHDTFENHAGLQIL